MNRKKQMCPIAICFLHGKELRGYVRYGFELSMQSVFHIPSFPFLMLFLSGIFIFPCKRYQNEQKNDTRKGTVKSTIIP